jgi:hypothetical protein
MGKMMTKKQVEEMLAYYKEDVYRHAFSVLVVGALEFVLGERPWSPQLAKKWNEEEETERARAARKGVIVPEMGRECR